MSSATIPHVGFGDPSSAEPRPASRRAAATRRPGLIWPIKTAFVAYVERMRDGDVSVDDGALRLDDGAFFFPLVSRDERRIAFGGAVSFTGHHGMLVLSIGRPAILGATPRPLLVIADDESADGHLPFAELDGPGPDGPGQPAPGGGAAVPRLTDEGAELFFDHYRAGTPLDALEIRLLAGTAASAS